MKWKFFFGEREKGGGGFEEEKGENGEKKRKEAKNVRAKERERLERR